MSDFSDTKFAEVAWTANDVLAVYPQFSHEQAVDWLIENERVIVDIMTERGWQAIEDLMWEQGIKKGEGW